MQTPDRMSALPPGSSQGESNSDNKGNEGNTTPNVVFLQARGLLHAVASVGNPDVSEPPTLVPDFDGTEGQEVFDQTPAYGAVADQLVRNGYFPVPVVPRDKATYVSDWSTATLDIIPSWMAQYQNHGVGIRSGGGLLVVDADTYDPDLSAQVLGLALEMLGQTPMRIGSKGGALLYQCADVGGGEVWSFPDYQGKVQAVELRGSGKQIVAYGVNPLSKQPNRWIGGHPLTTPKSTLPTVTMDQVRALLLGLGGTRKAAQQSQRYELPDKLLPHATHNHLVSRAAQLAARHYDDPEAIFAILWKELEERREPPLPPQSEVREIAKWAASKGGSINSDLDAAEEFAKVFGPDHKYGRGVWWNWTGNRFQMDENGAVERAVKTLVRALEHKASSIPDNKLRTDRERLARGFQTAGKIAAVEKLARTELGCVVRPDDFDADLMMLNVQNGLIDLRTGAIRPTNREDLVTKVAPVTFDQEAKCPRWLQFLHEETFKGEADVVRYLQKYLGYSLSGSTQDRSLLIFWGDGDNGKSVLLETVKAILGEGQYALTAAPSLLLQQRGDAIPNDLAALAGARLVTASETDRNQKFAVSRVKNITGDERVTARFMRKEFFSYQPQAKLNLATNGLPAFDGADKAFINRLRVVKFRNTVPRDKINRTLKAELLTEAAGILNWLLEGCRLWQEEGLTPPPSVLEAVREYADKMDRVGQFLHERCVITKNAADKIKRPDLWFCFRGWLGMNLDNSNITLEQWTGDIEKHGVVFKPKSNGNPWFFGVRLLTEAELKARESSGE
ncbi:phage/plasmid primase, P4 family [Magnetospirillum sp. ME-1]|uniref:phage/plasmid primase, P4 family n=1 Tax=Magnetospirillum sp. ME-1 TaxID=1639348 RepID=UPI00143D82C4|nr:phage/plasmid primase, P4 family [Magnetospirillum sp. ME-1]